MDSKFKTIFTSCLLNKSSNIDDDINRMITLMGDENSFFKDDAIKNILEKFFKGFIHCYIYNKENKIDEDFHPLNIENFNLFYILKMSKNRYYPDSRHLLQDYLFLINFKENTTYNLIHDSIIDYLDINLF